MSPAPSTASCDREVDLPRHPFPGDLYLDPDVPASQRVRMGQGRWRAEATHVWTGTGWTRLVAGQIRLVPSGGPAHQPPVRPPVLTAVSQEPTLFDEAAASDGGATVIELRPSVEAAKRRRGRYAALEHRWAS